VLFRAKKEENMELGCEGNLSNSFSVLNTDFSSSVHNYRIFDDGKFELDMQTDSRKLHNNLFKIRAIDTTSIDVIDESCLVQMSVLLRVCKFGICCSWKIVVE